MNTVVEHWDGSVGDFLMRCFRRFANEVAVRGPASSTTYGQLGLRSMAIARALVKAGLQPGGRVILLARNCDEYFEAEHAVFLAGGVRVALSPRLHVREVLHIANDCSATFIIAEQWWREELARNSAELPGGCHVLQIDSLPTDDADVPLPRRRGTDDAALLYTSGTTGQPKGAAITHRGWLAMVRLALVELPPLSEHDVMLHAAPLSHASGYLAMSCMARGAKHITCAEFEPEAVLRTIESDKVTVTIMVPTMVNALVDEATKGSYDLSSLRLLVYGGSPFAPARLRKALEVFDCDFVQVYGLSEVPFPISALSAADHRFGPDEVPERLGSAGKVNPFVDVRIVDESGNDCGPGAVGEILVRSETTMRGYWNKPAETAAALTSDGWFHTGDLGKFDEQGYLYIVDRLKDMIISGGYNIYPAEVENAILSNPQVREVAVVGAPDEHWGQTVTAFVVPQPGASLTEADVVATCQQRLASYKKPRRVIFLDNLPKTGSGKIKRDELRRRF